MFYPDFSAFLGGPAGNQRRKGTEVMTRREARELAVILMFERSFCDSPMEDILETAAEARDTEPDDFARDLALGADSYIVQIDQKIADHSQNWSKERISRISMAIMRVAIYEMLYKDDSPVSVSINEAVELAKKYGGDDDPGFINGVLGGIARSMPETV